MGDAKRRIVKATQQGQRGFGIVACTPHVGSGAL